MKKTLSAVLIFFMITVSGLSALDFGGSFSSATDFKTDSGLSNEEAIGLWFESGKMGDWSFETKLDLLFSVSDMRFYFNPDYLKLGGLFKSADGSSLTALTLGRFTTGDFSGRVLSQKLDGISVSFSYPAFEITATAGYTGLFFSRNGSLLSGAPSVVLSKTDAAMSTDTAVLFQSPRAVEMLTLSLPQIVAKQTVSFSFIAQEDMRPMFDVLAGYGGTAPVLLQEGETAFYADKGGAFDTEYIGIGISGPSVSSLYHSIYYYLGTGRTLTYSADADSPTGKAYKYEQVLSHMAGLNLDYYLTEFLGSRIGLSVLFGTGDDTASGYIEGNTEGIYTQFTPISGSRHGLVFSPAPGNILSAAVTLSSKPLSETGLPFVSNTQIQLDYSPFFRIGSGPISVSGIDPSFAGKYLGSEIDLTMNLRPFSDLGGIIQTGLFLPNTAAFTDSKDNPVFMTRLTLSLSF